jgi:hypothetical protein
MPPRFPLEYPHTIERSKKRFRSSFDPQGRRTILQAYEELVRQLELFGAREIIVTTNIPITKVGKPYSRFAEPDDPGVGVYFKDPKGIPRATGCDLWDRVKDNLWAIAKDIDAQRGRLRWGVKTQEELYEEMKYLTPPGQTVTAGQIAGNWWVVLKVDPNASLSEIEQAYRDLARYYHPDSSTGNEKMMALINRAIADARAEKKRVGVR